MFKNLTWIEIGALICAAQDRVEAARAALRAQIAESGTAVSAEALQLAHDSGVEQYVYDRLNRERQAVGVTDDFLADYRAHGYKRLAS